MRPSVFVVVDEAVVPRGCDGRGSSFKPWGYARERAIRERDGRRRLVRPRRVRCRGCRVTHVLLLAHVAPRRADLAPVILGALLAKAGGRGHRSIAADLSLPAGTVRGWLRRGLYDFDRAVVLVWVLRSRWFRVQWNRARFSGRRS